MKDGRKATEWMTGMAKGIAVLALAAIAIVAAAIPAWFGVARHEELEQAASPKTGGGSGELERHVARLEAESARIEAVRQRAESLNDKIADLERRGKSTTSAEGTAALRAPVRPSRRWLTRHKVGVKTKS